MAACVLPEILTPTTIKSISHPLKPMPSTPTPVSISANRSVAASCPLYALSLPRSSPIVPATMIVSMKVKACTPSRTEQANLFHNLPFPLPILPQHSGNRADSPLNLRFLLRPSDTPSRAEHHQCFVMMGFDLAVFALAHVQARSDDVELADQCAENAEDVVDSIL